MTQFRRLAIFLVASASVLFASFGVQGSAHAATEALTMTPTVVRPYIKPGGTYRSNFQVINQGQKSYNVRIYAAPYSVQNENYTPDFQPIPGKPPVEDWLHFSQENGVINPNQTFTVNYTLTIPPGTAPGGYYAVAFAETQSPPTQGRGVVVNEQVGEIFYIQVAGPVKRSGKVLSWMSAFWQKPPLTAALRLENDGGLHYASNIKLQVSDLFGTAKYTLATQKEILPQTIRLIPVSWAGAPSLGLFKVNGSATVNGTTNYLATKWVLIMSTTVRKISLAIGIVLVLLIVVWLAGVMVGRSKRRRKKPADKHDS